MSSSTKSSVQQNIDFSKCKLTASLWDENNVAQTLGEEEVVNEGSNNFLLSNGFMKETAKMYSPVALFHSLEWKEQRK